MDKEQKFLITVAALASAVLCVLLVGGFARSAYQSHLVASHPHPLEFACADASAERMHAACLTLKGQQ